VDSVFRGTLMEPLVVESTNNVEGACMCCPNKSIYAAGGLYEVYVIHANESELRLCEACANKVRRQLLKVMGKLPKQSQSVTTRWRNQ
jgi:hypothetical protein